jgi:glutathione synthase/RimK-type ligase-like ATP-grasp enzyme
MQKIHLIHENREWCKPLTDALEARGLPVEDWFLDEGSLDLSQPPPEGVFYNRMSASSHTRDHRYAPEFAASVLAWLDSHGRRVVNPTRALQLELSKVAQYATLEAHGVRTPRTIAVFGNSGLVGAAGQIGAPFITKHNRAGKGLGVHLFHSTAELSAYVESPGFEAPIDGTTLIQEYIRSPEPFITRCEFVGGEFLYAVRVDTSDGFLLCPADECQDTDATLCAATSQAKFQIVEDFDDPIIEDYGRVLESNGIDVAGIEFIVDADGNRYTYDINTNTNYNPRAEAAAGVSGIRAIADLLCRELESTGYRGPGIPSAANG